jgi:hypothetical protein
MTLDLVASLEPGPGGIDYHWILFVETRHHACEIVVVERIEIPLNQFFLGCHFLGLPTPF